MTNQQYWLQYPSLGEIATPMSLTVKHLIWSSNTSEALDTKQRLVPLNLSHTDTYLHGLFDFASIN